MWSWLAFGSNVMLILGGIPCDIIYAFANMYYAVGYQKDLMKTMPWVFKSPELMALFVLFQLAPVLRLCIQFPLLWRVYSVSRRFWLTLALSEEPEMLLVRTICVRTKSLADWSESDEGCCSMSREEVEAVRFLMSEEQRLAFLKAGGLGEDAEAILNEPLSAEEQEDLLEWETLAKPDKCCHNCCEKCCKCRSDRKKIVVRCKELEYNSDNNVRCFYSEILIYMGSMLNLVPEAPLPPRFLFVYKLQLAGAIVTILTYCIFVARGRHKWYSPLKLLSFAISLKYIIGMKSVDVIRTKYPLKHYGMMLTGVFPADSMWDAWCGAVTKNFSWGEWMNVWQFVGLDQLASSSTTVQDKPREYDDLSTESPYEADSQSQSSGDDTFERTSCFKIPNILRCGHEEEETDSEHGAIDDQRV